MGVYDLLNQETKNAPVSILELSVRLLNMGDCFNLKMPTNGGDVFWETCESFGGYKLQKNFLTQHARIIDTDNYRIAWGSFEVMKEKFERITGKEFLRPGDVIGIPRRHAGRLYAHYAIYIGGGRIIHYAAPDGDMSGRITVHEAGIEEFFRGDKEYFVLQFDEGRNNRPVKIQAPTDHVIGGGDIECILGGQKKGFGHIYSAEETIQRARSRIGEEAYHLFENNCEHFAIWCKTGISESYQVNDLKEILNRIKDR